MKLTIFAGESRVSFHSLEITAFQLSPFLICMPLNKIFTEWTFSPKILSTTLPLTSVLERVEKLYNRYYDYNKQKTLGARASTLSAPNQHRRKVCCRLLVVDYNWSFVPVTNSVRVTMACFCRSHFVVTWECSPYYIKNLTGYWRLLVNRNDLLTSKMMRRLRRSNGAPNDD
jgi:hypothetical protein